MKFKATLRMIWGLAKSPELSMTDEELHIFVEARTGKSSLKELSQQEKNEVAHALIALKPVQEEEKRGNPATARQRWRIRQLAAEIGWDNPARLDGLAKKMTGVEKVEWLDNGQCSKLIEALKEIRKREVGKNGGTENKEDDRERESIQGRVKEKVAGGRIDPAGQTPAQPEEIH